MKKLFELESNHSRIELSKFEPKPTHTHREFNLEKEAKIVTTLLDGWLDESIVKAVDQESSQGGTIQWQHQKDTRGVLFTFLIFTFSLCFIFYFTSLPIEENVKFKFGGWNFSFEQFCFSNFRQWFSCSTILIWLFHCFCFHVCFNLFYFMFLDLS